MVGTVSGAGTAPGAGAALEAAWAFVEEAGAACLSLLWAALAEVFGDTLAAGESFGAASGAGTAFGVASEEGASARASEASAGAAGPALLSDFSEPEAVFSPEKVREFSACAQVVLLPVCNAA